MRDALAICPIGGTSPEGLQNAPLLLKWGRREGFAGRHGGGGEKAEMPRLCVTRTAEPACWKERGGIHPAIR